MTTTARQAADLKNRLQKVKDQISRRGATPDRVHERDRLMTQLIQLTGLPRHVIDPDEGKR
jgi:hypothetical protein